MRTAGNRHDAAFSRPHILLSGECVFENKGRVIGVGWSEQTVKITVDRAALFRWTVGTSKTKRGLGVAGLHLKRSRVRSNRFAASLRVAPD